MLSGNYQAFEGLEARFAFFNDFLPDAISIPRTDVESFSVSDFDRRLDFHSVRNLTHHFLFCNFKVLRLFNADCMTFSFYILKANAAGMQGQSFKSKIILSFAI